MPEIIGTISNIKVYSLLTGTINAFDFCNITLQETETGTSWLFYLWLSRDDDAAVHRVVETQRLALAREAAMRNLTVHVWAESDSGFIDGIQVDTP